jgi:hypothetical protein
MSAIRRVLVLVALALAIPVATAQASSSLEAQFQDQTIFLGDPAQIAPTLQVLRDLGVQRLRVGVLWYRIAPNSDSRTRPKHFKSGDPGAYPAANWAQYDAIVSAAAQYGIKLNFDLGGVGAPFWATKRAPKSSLSRTWYPSASDFGGFVHAVATRYSGHYRPSGAASALPRVNYWSIWNEPNVGASGLAPQVAGGVEVAPRLYRGLADAAYTALSQTGHKHDTILVGELASTGHANPGYSLGMQPLRFLRALFCVDKNYHALSGRAASSRGCPTTASASRKFRSQNPVLFQATGWSHHPYRVTSTAPPNTPSPRQDPDWVTMADLSKLESALDKVQRVYGSHKRYNLYLTEYGYNTDPPQSGNAVSPDTQATYLNQAEYMAWHDKRIQTLTQYTLRDSATNLNIFSSYAAGLLFSNNQPKPSFQAYALPIWMPKTSASAGSSLEVWGCIKPAHFAGSAGAQIQFQPASGGAFVPVGTATVRSGCYFDQHVQFPGSGTVRLAYSDPTFPGAAGGIVYSRPVPISLH